MIKDNNINKRCFIACDEQTIKIGGCTCISNQEELIEDKTRNEFISLLGEDKIKYIEKNNWVTYETNYSKFHYINNIIIQFLIKDSKDDTVIFFSIGFDKNKNLWFSSNCIDVKEISFKTYDEMKKHVHEIEDDIINNNFILANLP